MVRVGRALCGSPSPTPCPSRVTAPHPGGAGISPEKETPQPPWAAWARAPSPSEGRSSSSGSAGASSAPVCARCPLNPCPGRGLLPAQVPGIIPINGLSVSVSRGRWIDRSPLTCFLCFLQGLASCFGICAINHLEETLAKLEDFVRSDVFKKSVGLFSLFKVRAGGAPAATRPAAKGSRGLLRTRRTPERSQGKE